MGGNGSVTLAMKHPGVYGAVASHGGTLSFNVAKGVFAQAVIAQTPDGMMSPEEAVEAHDAGLYFPSYAYAMSAAFSPNLDNPPYFVDLPLEWPSPEIIEEVWVRWLENGDALTMLNTYGHNLASLRGLYIDSETPDSVGSDFMAEAFHQALDAAGIQHEFQLYPAEELPEEESWYSRYRVSLPFISNVLLHEEDLEAYMNVFFMSLAPGLSMISLPLKPIKPYTARSLAEEIGATVVIKYDETLGSFVGYTMDIPDFGFLIEGGRGYIVNVPEGKVVPFVGAAWTNEPPVEAAPPAQRDSAWAFAVSGSVEGVSVRDGAYTVTVKNLRTGDTFTEEISPSGYFVAAYADLTREAVIEVGDRIEVAVLDSSGELVSGPSVHKVTLEGIRDAVMSVRLRLGHTIPAKSVLLQNYPNPFNPETWIPYNLRDASPVTISIYNAAGQLIRTLDLGHRVPGVYTSRSRAAYWDGKNEAREQVASGVYFYTIQAGDFTATKKMVVAK